MTEKIGVPLHQEARRLGRPRGQEGRAEPVSALIAGGLELPPARAQLEAVVAELRTEAGELDDQAKVRPAGALAAAGEAYRRHRGTSAGHAAGEAYVALAAAGPGHAVLTSADADIAGVSPALVLAHV